MSKAKLSSIARNLEPARPRRREPTTLDFDPNPERGQRGHFIPTNVTLPEEMIVALQALGRRRRREGRPNRTVSELLREGAALLLEKEAAGGE